MNDKTDYRDFVIEALADSEAALRDQLIDLTIERDSYRGLSRAAVHQLYDLATRLDRLREQHHRLLDEHRHLLRAQTMAPRMEAA
jgi:hypothetical protein